MQEPGCARKWRAGSAISQSSISSSTNSGEIVKIGILPGDDIGLEVVPECVKVMKAAASRSGLVIDWRPLPIGKRGAAESGNTLPAVTEAALRELDGGG